MGLMQGLGLSSYSERKSIRAPIRCRFVHSSKPPLCPLATARTSPENSKRKEGSSLQAIISSRGFSHNQSVPLSSPHNALDISLTISAPVWVLGEQDLCSVRARGRHVAVVQPSTSQCVCCLPCQPYAKRGTTSHPL